MIPTETVKFCKRCSQVKDISEFKVDYRCKPDNYRKWCKECEEKFDAEWRTRKRND